MFLIPLNNKKYIENIYLIYGHKTTYKLTNRGIYKLFSIVGIYKSDLKIYMNNDNEVIGYGSIIRKLNFKTLKLETWIAGIYIIESFRNKNFGTRMMQEIIYECWTKNYNQLHLYVKKDNKNACRLYEKLGFYYEPDHDDSVYHKMKLINKLKQ